MDVLVNICIFISRYLLVDFGLAQEYTADNISTDDKLQQIEPISMKRKRKDEVTKTKFLFIHIVDQWMIE